MIRIYFLLFQFSICQIGQNAIKLYNSILLLELTITLTFMPYALKCLDVYPFVIHLKTLPSHSIPLHYIFTTFKSLCSTHFTLRIILHYNWLCGCVCLSVRLWVTLPINLFVLLSKKSTIGLCKKLTIQ